MRGPKPKPAALRVIEGNPGKRPIRPMVEMPRGTLPEPPAALNELARQEWNRVAPGLHALRLLETVDVAALAAYCNAWARWSLAESLIAEMAKTNQAGGLMVKTTKGNVIQNPLVGTSNKAQADMVRYAAEFGMTPSARSRVGSEGGVKPTSKWDGLIGGARTA